MKTKIIIKMDRDLSKPELDYLIQNVKEKFHHHLKNQDKYLSNKVLHTTTR